MTVHFLPERLGDLTPDGLDALPVFIDWISCHQTHPEGCPVINNGQVIKIDADQQVIFDVGLHLKVEGSFESSIQLRSDGKRVEFSGNISRFGRKDNLFGFTLGDTFRRINHLLNVLGLPPFSLGVRTRFADSGVKWLDGCTVTRIDLTCNYVTGSHDDAEAMLRVLSGHHVGRQKGSLRPDGQTIEYGSGSSYVYGKCYIKGTEMLKHSKKKKGRDTDPDLIQWVLSQGVIREEIELKRNYLAQKQLLYLGDINHSLLYDIYLERSQLRRLDMVKYEDTTQLPNHLKATYYSWRNGEKLNVSKATFHRHRNQLLKYGVDISIPSTVRSIPIRVRTVEIAALAAPDWYKRKFG